MLGPETFRALRFSIAEIPADVSNDAVGAYAPRLEDLFAPEGHAAALNPSTPIILGSRGAGKSFWAGILGQPDARDDASIAYPRLKLADEHLEVAYGFTGVGGPDGVSVDILNASVPEGADSADGRAFWWATIMRAAAISDGRTDASVSGMLKPAADVEEREKFLNQQEMRLRKSGRTLLIVFDALDTIANMWPRRRMLTESLLEVVWATRAFRMIKVKLFLRPDQIDDDGLRFVELPKLRTGAVRLEWSGSDLYGLLFARLANAPLDVSRAAFERLLRRHHIEPATRADMLSRRWILSGDEDAQRRVMKGLAGSFMAAGPNGFKKGKTYDWPIAHLSDAFQEVTPRSFLGLMIGAAKHGPVPIARAITPDGMRSGLRSASKTRVDQLHQEFPWIKGVLAPLAGLLLPQVEDEVFRVWRSSKTVKLLLEDALQHRYLPPFQDNRPDESHLFEALKRIGVMFRRRDDRLDMPDLFRVAAKLLKKGGTAPER